MSYVSRMSEFQMNSDWESYFERFQQFVLANKIEQERLVAVFLSTIGDQAYNLLRNLCFPDKPWTKSLNELNTVLLKHLKPTSSFISERYKFRKTCQRPGESIAEYTTKLKQAAMTCQFGEALDEALRDQLICGLQNADTRRRLLERQNLTFSSACEIASAAELIRKESMEFALPSSSTDLGIACSPVNKTVKFSHISDCTRCGNKHPANKCPARNWTCYTCRKKGHVAKCCRTKTSKSRKVHQISNVIPQESIPEPDRQSQLRPEPGDETPQNMLLSVTSTSQKRYEIVVDIEHIPIRMEIDTGAAMSVISETCYNKYFCNEPLQTSDVQLKTYSGQIIPTKGKMLVNVEFRNQRHKLPLFVVSSMVKQPSNMLPLLGRNWLEKLKLPWEEIFSTHCLHLSSGKESRGQEILQDDQACLMEKYKGVFQPGTGCIKGFQADILLREDAKPIFCKARPLPFNLKATVEAELQRLEKEGVMKKVTHSDWATPLVVIPKANGTQIRICGDYSVTLNPYSKVDHYPLPNSEDLFAFLAGGQIFTKIDLTNAYQQVPLTKESASLLTVNTPLGLYQYTRLPFGVASAPAIFQSIMDRILQEIPNASTKIFCYLDDILIKGINHSDCKASVEAVLSKLKQFEVRVNASKSIFFVPSIEYLGYKIDAEGIHPTEAKLRAIKEFPTPRNVTELRSFLGLINYYRRFIPNLSTMLSPLHELLKKDKKWFWSDKCDQAFTEAKNTLLSSSVLEHYDSSKPLVLTCDASSVGLGAVLSHRGPDGDERPIAFVSRTLTQSEQNYAQIEREALGIIFAVQKFHRFLYGRNFTLITDHQPLITLFGPKAPIPKIAAARIQRWAMILNAYSYSIQYRAGKKIANADALSRAPIKEEDREVLVLEEEMNFLSPIRETPLRAVHIAQATRDDLILSRVLEWTRYGGWPELVENSFLPFLRRKHELSIEQDCLMWGNRVIIPQKLRPQVLDLLHEEHAGIVGMKRRARSCFWWPNLDQEIEILAKACSVCQSFLPDSPPVPLHPWNQTDTCWERVHLDLAFWKSYKFLVVIDSFSKWVEIKLVADLSSNTLIENLRTIFASFGLPNTVVHDNVSYLVSEEMATFLKANGIRQMVTPPYHPASNGSVELVIRTIKTSLKKALWEDVKLERPRSVQHIVANFLLAYRTSPHNTTGVSPAELFLKRPLRTRISMLKPSMSSKVKEQTAHRSYIRDTKRNAQIRNFAIGDKVYVKNVRNKQTNWIPGVITGKRGDVIYDVQVEGRVLTFHVDHLRQRPDGGN